MGKSSEVKAELSDLMDSNQSYRKFRDVLHSVDPPCIPYLGMYLTDLTFIEEGNPNNIHPPDADEGVLLINFSKRKLVYNVILEIQQYQQTAYNLQPVEQIQTFLRKFPNNLDDSELWKMSLKREPRNADWNDLL